MWTGRGRSVNTLINIRLCCFLIKGSNINKINIIAIFFRTFSLTILLRIVLSVYKFTYLQATGKKVPIAPRCLGLFFQNTESNRQNY